MELNKTLKFLQHFSIISIGDNKIPNFPWKKQQTEKLTETKFSQNYLYKGGLFRSDGSEIPATTGFGICTGFEHLECVDVDLKVLSTAQEQRDFWNEYVTTLRDHILDFDDKVAIYKTKNAGFHLLYKTKRAEGNLKLAKLKGHTEAIIETRGAGGYIFSYPDNKYSKLSYFDIQYISDSDREIIMHCSKLYNHEEPAPEPIAPKTKKEYSEGLKPWDDFNNRVDVWDLLHDEFSIPSNGNKQKHILIKRHGSQSAYSGYIYKDSGCVYLFSTATRYPHEKLLRPSDIYALKYHNGDLSAAASAMYHDGYGDRQPKKIKELEVSVPDISEYDIETVEFPIDIYPAPLQSYLMECKYKLDSNIDYTGSALLWLISVCVGNSFSVQVKKGWTENATIWVSLVGKAGIGKTPSINKVIFPLEKINSIETRRYAKQMAEFREYDKLSKKEKDCVPEVEKPVSKQFIANDITLEALVDLHQGSDNAVGVFKDELAGWLKDMNKYRAGSDLEFWLSAWSGKSVFLNRITRDSSFVDKPFIPVMGGIQPGILNGFYTEENKDNGFMDRMLLSFPDATIDKYNENELSDDIMDWYSQTITAFYNSCKHTIKTDEDGGIISHIATLTDGAKKEWIRIFNEITDTQNSEDENEYLKSMYPKQKSYIPRFALLINMITAHFDPNTDLRYISRESMLKAEKLSKYFVNNAKKVKIDSVVAKDIKTVTKDAKTNIEKLKLIHEANPDFDKSKVSEMLGISRVQVYRLLKKLGV